MLEEKIYSPSEWNEEVVPLVFKRKIQLLKPRTMIQNKRFNRYIKVENKIFRCQRINNLISVSLFRILNGKPMIVKSRKELTDIWHRTSTYNWKNL